MAKRTEIAIGSKVYFQNKQFGIWTLERKYEDDLYRIRLDKTNIFLIVERHHFKEKKSKMHLKSYLELRNCSRLFDECSIKNIIRRTTFGGMKVKVRVVRELVSNMDCIFTIRRILFVNEKSSVIRAIKNDGGTVLKEFTDSQGNKLILIQLLESMATSMMAELVQFYTAILDCDIEARQMARLSDYVEHINEERNKKKQTCQ